MTAWIAPATDTYHFGVGEPHVAGRVPPGRCGDWCEDRGWKGWKAKDVVVNLDSDPNQDPGRFGSST